MFSARRFRTVLAAWLAVGAMAGGAMAQDPGTDDPGGFYGWGPHLGLGSGSTDRTGPPPEDPHGDPGDHLPATGHG